MSSCGTKKERIEQGYFTGKAQLSDYTGLSIRTIARMVKNGELPHKRVNGRLLLFNKQKVDRVLQGS